MPSREVYEKLYSVCQELCNNLEKDSEQLKSFSTKSKNSLLDMGMFCGCTNVKWWLELYNFEKDSETNE